ncbi:hypothetical protein HOK51_04615 [Candidatus Woesearchaeota archaeon]|jgi:hypothetical protein|nr:hypothetical protein [Candidatus Woesearchaeota archaeon]MBT6519107.1 hypothetical protein [Candidatus Woesearchaeota archaeon]MBT7366981.1 hypothetical protein [Candidatus Woesearchaeota archaeon]
MTIEEIDERYKLITDKNNLGKNCRGTSLYLLGFIEQDCDFDPKQFFLECEKNRYERNETGPVGSIAIWNDGRYVAAHTAIKIGENNFVHRKGAEGKIKVESLEDMFIGREPDFYMRKK